MKQNQNGRPTVLSQRRSLAALLFVLFAQEARAQDLLSQPDGEAGVSERSGRSFDNSEDLSSRESSGLFSGGGSKPLQRVRSIPLPQARSNSGSWVTASASSKDSAPLMGYRRSKPQMSELTTDFPARMIYLNGKNISTVRDQKMEGVTVRIDANGNVHISAPHYEVQESTHYRPLLPRDVPRVSKPAAAAEEAPPLLLGRQQKADPPLESQNPKNFGDVPPVQKEGDAAEGVEGDSKAASPTQTSGGGINKSPAEGQKL